MSTASPAIHPSGQSFLAACRVYLTPALFFLCVVPVLFVMHERANPGIGKEFSKGRDVHFIYQDATMLANGENPYGRIKNANLYENQKYTFYLPGFLLAAAASVKLGLTDYQTWMESWLTVSMLFHFGIGLLLYGVLWRASGHLFAILGSSFWFFSRWPLALFRSGQIDAVPIFFFVLALVLLARKPRLALFALGVSLAVKQMAAFLAPLFLFEVWRKRASAESRVREFTIDVASLLIVPASFSLPFILWDYESFFRMVLFPLTRDPRGARSVELFLKLPVELAKLPFLGLLCVAYWMSWKEKLSFHALAFWVMMLFLSFSSVFFSRYFCWAIPLVPLLCFESTLDSEDFRLSS